MPFDFKSVLYGAIITAIVARFGRNGFCSP